MLVKSKKFWVPTFKFKILQFLGALAGASNSLILPEGGRGRISNRARPQLFRLLNSVSLLPMSSFEFFGFFWNILESLGIF